MSYLCYALFAIIVLYTLLFQIDLSPFLSLVYLVCCNSAIYLTVRWIYHLSYLCYDLVAVIVLYILLFQIDLSPFLFLVCLVCCNSAIYLTFSDRFITFPISVMPCLLL